MDGHLSGDKKTKEWGLHCPQGWAVLYTEAREVFANTNKFVFLYTGAANTGITKDQ